MNLITFEYSSISEGMKTCDALLKQFPVTLEKHDLRCPGRYACLLSGSESSVEKMEKHLLTSGSLKCLSVKAIYNIDEKVYQAANLPINPKTGEDLLIVETKYLVDAYSILDQLTTDYQLDQYTLLNRLGLFGKGVVMVTGKPQQMASAYQMLQTPKYEKIVWQVELVTKPAFDRIRF